MKKQAIPLHTFEVVGEWSEISNGLFAAHYDELGWPKGEMPDSFLIEVDGLIVRAEKDDLGPFHTKYRITLINPRMNSVFLVYNYPKP